MIIAISYIRQKRGSTVTPIGQHMSTSSISFRCMSTHTEQKIRNILSVEEKITTLVPCGSLTVVS